MVSGYLHSEHSDGTQMHAGFKAQGCFSKAMIVWVPGSCSTPIDY